MKRNRCKILFLILSLFFVIFNLQSIQAETSEESSRPIANNEIFKEADYPLAMKNAETCYMKKSYLVKVTDGYMRVFFNGKTVRKGNAFFVEYYDDQFQIISRAKFDMELDYWGGFYAGKDAYYVVEGKDNLEEKDDNEVVRVIKYDFNWNRIASASITGNTSLFGGEVRKIFDSRTVDIAEHDNNLYIASGAEGYVVESLGRGHQTGILISVDEQEMTGKIVFSYSGHSFSQDLAVDETGLYLYEESEGAESTLLSKFKDNKFDESRKAGVAKVFKYGGERTSVWAVETNASADAIVLSENNVLGVGTSIDQTKYNSTDGDTPVNIYLTVTPKNNIKTEASTFKWITNYTENKKSFYGIHLVKIDSNRFLLMWQENNEEGESVIDDPLSGNILHYILLDGNGERIGEEKKTDVILSECTPIIVDNKAVYYASSSNEVKFIELDLSSGECTSKNYKVAGEKATWKYENNTLYIEGEGDLSVSSESAFRNVLVNTAHSFIESDYENDWMKMRELNPKVIISEGITSIPKEAFKFFDTDSVVKLPESLQSIGEDAFWSGYYSRYDSEKLVYVSFEVTCNTYAHKYVVENKYRSTVLHKAMDDGKIVKEPTCTEEGLKIYTCAECNETKEEKLSALGHNFSEEWTFDQEPTCTEPGEKSNHCTRCDKRRNITYVPALRHSWDDGKVTKEATCTENGLMVYTCTRCDETREETLYALGHDYSKEWTIDKEPTCTEPGEKSHHCTRCDDRDRIRSVYALGHSWNEGEVTKKSTCVADGLKIYTCTRCNETKEEIVYAPGHDYSEEWTIDKEATYYEDGSKSHHCSRCDAKIDVTVIPRLSFVDVNEATDHYDDILWLATNKVTAGWDVENGQKEFRPYVDVARCDMAAFIRRLAVSNNWLDAATWKPSEEDWNTFTDIDKNSPHAEDVLWLAHTGISEGWTEEDGTKTFRPLITVARCDMAAFLQRLASKQGLSDASTWEPGEADWTFADIDANSPHAKEVLWLAHSGVSKGWDEGNGTTTFRPYIAVARCDMAAFLRRLVG